MNDDITNFPLSWPNHQARTPYNERRHARFSTKGSSTYTGAWAPARKHSIAEGARELELEIKRMGGRDIIISTNLKVKANGLPYSGQRTPDDPGVAVYFHWRKRDLVFAADKWVAIEDNLWAIVKHIEALRGQERWGVGSLEQAFAGYMALPDPDTKSWWEVLNVSPMALEETVSQSYRALARKYHPDGTEPNVELFLQVQKAWESYEESRK